jgi:hypothetical protein
VMYMFSEVAEDATDESNQKAIGSEASADTLKNGVIEEINHKYSDEWASLVQ